MTYRDIVLKLLKSREDLICVEHHLTSDFMVSNNSGESLSEWCDIHNIAFVAIREEHPPKVLLKKNSITKITETPAISYLSGQ